jgi:hypothetical protein
VVGHGAVGEGGRLEGEVAGEGGAGGEVERRPGGDDGVPLGEARLDGQPERDGEVALLADLGRGVAGAVASVAAVVLEEIGRPHLEVGEEGVEEAWRGRRGGRRRGCRLGRRALHRSGDGRCLDGRSSVGACLQEDERGQSSEDGHGDVLLPASP